MNNYPTLFKAYAIWNKKQNGIQDGAPLFQYWTDATQWIRKQDNYTELTYRELYCSLA
jgi:hypothetical protein